MAEAPESSRNHERSPAPGGPCVEIRTRVEGPLRTFDVVVRDTGEKLLSRLYRPGSVSLRHTPSLSEVSQHLYLSSSDWPGIHCATALCTGKPLEGRWIDGTKYRDARNRGENVVPSQFATQYQIHLDPLPCWELLDAEVWRGYVREMVGDIEVETLAEHERNQTAPCGASAVLRNPPHYSPGRQKRGPAPQFHVASQAAWDLLLAGYREFWVAYQIAAEKVSAGVKSARFPEDCFPSRLPYVPPC